MSDNTAMVPVNLRPTSLHPDRHRRPVRRTGQGRRLHRPDATLHQEQGQHEGPDPHGHYGIPESDEEIIDLGDSMDLLPLARRPKAIDMTDMRGAGHRQLRSWNRRSSSGSPPSPEKPIRHCQYGPSFLVYERSTGRFLEFFCGNKSSRSEARNSFRSCRSRQADIDAKAAAGNDVSDLEAARPDPVTLEESKVAENGKGIWHVPVVVMCGTPFTKLPSRRRDRAGNQQAS